MKNKVFLVVSSTDNASVVKKHADIVVSPAGLVEVSRQMRPGDTLVVYSITDVFATIEQLFEVFSFCTSNKVSFESVTEKYLNFSASSPLSVRIQGFLATIQSMKNQWITACMQAYRDSQLQQYLWTGIEFFCIQTIARIFSNDSLLKR